MDIEYNPTNVKAIAQNLKFNQESDVKCAIIIGAGVSVTAGIPAADGIMKEIKKKFAVEVNRNNCKTYQDYMKVLTPDQRKKLIEKFVSKSGVNQAHLYLGALVEAGYVDRILTTNFDPLVIRSLALYNQFPAVYDFAVSKKYISGKAASLSVFHLNGQIDGFVQLNTDDQFASHTDMLKEVFSDVARNRCWIVVGYSGENDPVFEALEKVDMHQHKFYWVSYSDKDPKAHLLKKILNPKENEYGYYLKGYSADDFFLELAKELKLNMPKIIDKPFSYLKQVVATIKSSSIDGRSVERTKETKGWIDAAIKGFEDGEGFEQIEVARKEKIQMDTLVQKIRDIWINEQYEKVDKIADEIMISGNEEAKKYLAYAFYNWGNVLVDLAAMEKGKKSEVLYQQAIEKYQKSIEIKQDDMTFYNLGNALADLADMEKGKKSEALYKQAGEKYRKAIEIKPDKDQAFYNWGNVLSNLAAMEKGEKSEALYKQAIEKYLKSIEIMPDDRISYKLGLTLVNLARTKEGADMKKMLKEALIKFKKLESTEEGKYSYDISCSYSLLDNKEKALKWLERSLRLKATPDKKHILGDADLDNIKKTKEFKNLLVKYRIT